MAGSGGSGLFPHPLGICAGRVSLIARYVHPTCDRPQLRVLEIDLAGLMAVDLGIDTTFRVRLPIQIVDAYMYVKPPGRSGLACWGLPPCSCASLIWSWCGLSVGVR